MFCLLKIQTEILNKLRVRSAELKNRQMSAVTVSLCSTLLFVGIVIFVSAEEKIITVESGKNVTLPCRAPKNSIVVKWSRADLEPEYVLFYRDEQFDPQEQHHSFVNRVDLQDRQMKDGDISLILKDVTINDTGKYMSHVVQGVREPMRLISIINLRVDPPGQTGGDTEDGGKEDGSVGLIVGLLVFAVPLVIFAFGFLMYRKGEQTKTENSYKPPPEL